MINRTELDEKRYLKKIISKLQSTHERLATTVNGYDDEILENKDYIWQNKADLDGAEKAANREIVYQLIDSGELALTQMRQIERLIDSPYFGRVDFSQDNEAKPDTFYIGLHNFSERAGEEILVYDWRAPVSTLFYDFEKGSASYIAPAGKIKGLIDLKRQYKIRRGSMEYMIESEINIGDDILQKELSQSANDKMKNIVVSIQREQNEIIRNATARTLIVQGVAGSGKTSIALHRVAFLLYRNSETLSSDNMMIISPNKVFADYISTVLPELGEENIQEIDMMEIALEMLGGTMKIQTFSDQVNFLMHDASEKDLERIKFKATTAFANELHAYLHAITKDGFQAADLSIDDVKISAEAVQMAYDSFAALPVSEQLEQTAEQITVRLNMERETRLSSATARKIRTAIRRMFPYKDSLSLYAGFYKQEDRKNYFKHKSNQPLSYEDVYPLIYTRLHFERVEGFKKIEHLLIDEMQDYTPVQYAVLRKVFHCSKTILGDSNQSVNPYTSTSLEIIEGIFPEAESVKLCRSYRSTMEITELAQTISQNEDLIPVERHGSKPTIQKFDDEKEELKHIRKLVKEHLKSEYQSLGIVCKTSRQAKKLYDALSGKFTELVHLDFESREYQDGIIITSAHMAKGLEFDQVIVPHVDAQTYKTDLDRSLLYIACTRAMHKLDLTSSGKITSFL